MKTRPEDVLEIAKSIVRAKQEHFRDLWFYQARTDESFSLMMDQPGGWLRFSVPEGSVLHFASLRIWMQDETGTAHAIDKFTQVDLGSQYVGTELHPVRLLNFDNPHLAFHTDKNNPTLTVQFEPGQVQRIEINNRGDIYAARAWDLSIEVSADGENWSKIYAHPQRAAEFRAMCRNTLVRSYPITLVDDVMAIITQAYAAPREIRRPMYDFSLAYGGVCRGALAQVLDREILFNRRLEMTSSHGPQETFRFWSAEEKTAYMGFAASAIRRFQAQGDAVFLGYGPLLGMVRSGALIPHDDDIDLVMVLDRGEGETTASVMQRFTQRLGAAGYRVKGDFPNHRHIGEDGRPKVMDMFLAIRDGDRIYFNPAREHEVPENVVFPLVETEFMGSDILIPSNVLSFLTYMYGPDWHTPMPAFSHGWKPLT